MSAQSDKLDAIGIDALCERIESGETYREMAADIGVSVGLLTKWLTNDAHREQSARALNNSAESWLDRGLHALNTADGSDARLGAEITRARAIAQECARRAAIRNPKYSERHTVQHADADGNNLTVQIVQFGELPKK